MTVPPEEQRVAVDAMGGDHAPQAVVAGAILAAQQHGIRSILIGDEQQILACLKDTDPQTRNLMEIVHTYEVIGMGDHPVEAIRKNRQASMVLAIRMIRDREDVTSAMSAGNSGAFMAGGKLILGGIPGIFRPGFTIHLPTPQGPVVLLDAGAAVDCSAETLAQFGELGHHYVRLILRRESPRIGLLNVGEEEGKGSQEVKDAYEYLQQQSLNFIGNIEGDQVFEGVADVVVCDGFVGNVLLKTAEGVVSRLMHELKAELTASPVRKAGALLAQGAFRALKQRYDWEEMSGGVLLGVQGNIVVTHGKSRERGIMNAIRLAHRTGVARLAQTIASELTGQPTVSPDPASTAPTVPS